MVTTTYNVLCDINLAPVLLLAVPMAAVNLKRRLSNLQRGCEVGHRTMIF